MAAPVFRLTKVFAVLFSVLLLGCSDNARTPVAPDGGAIVEHDSYANATSADLGRLVFFDKRMSLHGNQACAACHAPEFGFTGPVPGKSPT